MIKNVNSTVFWGCFEIRKLIISDVCLNLVLSVKLGPVGITGLVGLFGIIATLFVVKLWGFSGSERYFCRAVSLASPNFKVFTYEEA